jgi:GNAT superfamily N-acetyltransferase
VSGFELRPYDETKRPEYLRLLAEAWGPDALSPDEFDWWFARNPAGSLMSVAERDGRVVGVAGHTLARARVDGGEEVVSFSVHATTDPSARGLGIFQALERKHEEQATERGVTAVLAFASAPTEPLFLGPLGWSEIDRRRVWVRPLAGPVPALPADGRVRRVERFGPEAERAYRRAAPRLRNHLVRDAAYLNWRYVESPRDYRAFESENGFAALGFKLHRGRRVAVVADLVAPPREARELLLRCAAEARGEVRFLFAVPPAGLGRTAMAAVGFLPSHVTLHFVGKPLAGRLDTDGSAWCVSLGDTDFF